MSLLRPFLSRRGRLLLVAAAFLLIGTLIVAPSVSGAKAAVKQFTATMLPPDTAIGGVPGTWTEQVRNCGAPIVPPCTRASTIGIGQLTITVPSEFRPITSVSASSPEGRSWSASYNSSTGIISAQAVTGSNKLQSGERVDITFSAAPTTCDTGSRSFATKAYGSLPPPSGELFDIQGLQPSLTLNGCGLESGGSITDPETGQTETIAGDFDGHVLVTFGGDNLPDCSEEAGFGALGAQWESYHLPAPVTITPASDFVAGGPKVSTSEFDQSIAGGDSSWYLICYAVPIDEAHPEPFASRGREDGLAINQSIGGIPNWVGILASCVEVSRPCVSEQFLTTGPGAPPWNPGDNRVHIAITIDPGDPHKR